MLQQIKQWPAHIKEAIAAGKGIKLQPCSEILLIGLGSSASAGKAVQALLSEKKLKISVVESDILPSWAGAGSAVFLISYSGNSAPVLAALKEAYKRGCAIVGLTSGGKLKELKQKYEFQLIELPKGLTSATALCFNAFAVLSVLHHNGIAKLDPEEVARTIKALSHAGIEESAVRLAEEIGSKGVFVVCSEQNRAIAEHLVQAVTELAKQRALSCIVPKACYGELLGFVRLKPEDWHAVLLADQSDTQLQKKSSAEVKEILKSKKISITEISLKEREKCVKLFSTLALGSYLACALAEKLGTDPADASSIIQINSRL